MTTAMWSLIDRGDLAELSKALESDTDLVYIRSEDGRGPLFWAYEYERYDLVKLLLDNGQCGRRSQLLLSLLLVCLLVSLIRFDVVT